jgi:hypothetical protein
MEGPVVALVGQDVLRSRYPSRVSALQSHRRHQRLRAWGTMLSVVIGCIWLALAVVGGLAH